VNEEATPVTHSRILQRKLAIAGAYALLATGAGCAAVETAVSVEPGASFTLAPGETALVKGTDTRITFRQMREDSRCPVDVTCVWEGDAKIEIVISRAGAADETRILSIRPTNNEVRTGNLRLRFVSLAPVPRQAEANTTRKYRAEFVVDQL
jgi:hypothetical protein